MKLMRLLFSGLLLTSLVGCSSFGGNSEEVDPPAELADFSAQLRLEKIWDQDIGSGLSVVDMVLNPVLDGDYIYAVDPRGRVSVLDKSNGRVQWRTDLDAHITGSVALTPDLVLVGSQEGDLYALDRMSGDELWTTRLSSEILAPADGNQQVVVVVTQDGTIHGLNAADGSIRWSQDIQKPLLTLRGNGQPRVTADTVYVGLDNGKLAAYRLADGGLVWETRVAVPEGTTELQRMVDVDTRPLIFSDLVFALSYQGGLMAINLESGRSSWFLEGSSRKDLAYFGGLIVATMLDSSVASYSVTTGAKIWETSAFLNRGVTAPVATDRYVAVGETEQGYIHLLNRRTGDVIGRIKVDSSGISAAPVSDGRNLYVLDRDGKISAYSVQAI